METTQKPEYYTKHELRVKMNVSIDFIDKHILTRRLPGMVRVGSDWRFRIEDVERNINNGSLLLPDKI